MNKFFLIFVVLFCSCRKEEITVSDPIEIDLTKSLFTGTFTSAEHPTSGKIFVTKTEENKYVLQMQDFKTDAGPDLHVYLATSKDAKDNIDVLVKPKNGTYTIEVNQAVDFSKYKYVLIWCKSFSVLFGSAELK